MMLRRAKTMKLVVGLGTLSLLVSLCLWSQCHPSHQDNNFYREDTPPAVKPLANDFEAPVNIHRNVNSLRSPGKDTATPIKYREIDCVINGEYTIKCRREQQEVYVPFSFIQKYFEIYGKVERKDGYERLEWQHSNSMVHPPREHYTPAGVFMSFEYYHVEERDRVKCISAMEGVPVSTQWTPEGHFYPIQIAQFGLSHHSKHLTEPEPDMMVLEDGEEEDMADWTIPNNCRAALVPDSQLNTKVMEFHGPDSLRTPGMTLLVEEKSNVVLVADLKLISNGSLTVTVETSKKVEFRIHYVLTSSLISMEGQDIFYGLGNQRQGSWVHLARDIGIDFQKGLALKYTKSKRAKLRLSLGRIVSVTLRGQGSLDNLTLASAAHLDQFYNAADWLLAHQDQKGGWPITVRRKLIPGVMELEAGWYSAMAQGQAMSLLVRAYLKTKRHQYLQAAVDAIKLFQIPSSQGGVLARFANRYDWYEEYPTTPSSYVLNGFIYSLLGLYDLKEVATGEDAKLASSVYDKGMFSLKHMLGMFDTGSGTFYDLRHVTIGITPNRARWDYHTTHINQLLQLSIIDNDLLFKNTAKRWMEYMSGKPAPHN